MARPPALKSPPASPLPDNVVQSLQRYASYLRAERTGSAHSLSAYLTDSAQFLRWLVDHGHSDCTQLSADTMHLWWQSTAPLAAATRRRKLAAIRAYLGWLRREGVLGSDPTLSLRSPRPDKRLPAFLTETELQQLLAQLPRSHAMDERNRAMLLLLYASGIRRSELQGLNWASLDLHRRTITVLGKGAKPRVVPVAAVALQALAAYRSRWQAEACPCLDAQAMFLGSRGQRCSLADINQSIAALHKLLPAGRRLHPHMLRHSYATHMLMHGADLRVLQEALGHASLSTTQTYTHLDIDQLRAVHHRTHPRSRGE